MSSRDAFVKWGVSVRSQCLFRVLSPLLRPIHVQALSSSVSRASRASLSG